MAQTSFALMTNLGRAKEAAALANATTIEITHIAIGDGVTVPSGGETELYNEVARKTISGHGTVVGAENVAYFDAFLAAGDGPYTIREAGLIDSDGDLIAIAHYDPAINKPIPASGQTVEGTVRLEVAFSDIANVTIVVDPAMMVALQRLTRLPWIPVISMTLATPPASPAVGDTYVIAASPTGAWSGYAGKIAEYTTAGWAIISPPDGHGVGLPNGRLFIRQGGVYSEFPGGDTLTLYIRTDGDDGNDGSANDAGHAFKTLQGAINFAMGRYGPGGKPIKLILGISGTYVTPSLPAGSAITIEGSMSSWAGFILTNGGAARSAISINNSYLSLRGVCIQTDSAGRVVIDATNGGVVDLNTVRVTEGSGLANTLIRAAYGAVVRLIDVIQLYADASYAIGVTGGTVNGVVGGTITFYTTPDYSGATVSVSHAGACYLSGVTVAGAATGKRYSAQLNGVIDTGGGGANFIPGNVAGTQTSGGQYA